MTSFASRMKKAFSDMKVHRKLIVVYVLTGLLPMCLMFTLFYTQMRRVLVEREIKNMQSTFDQAVDGVNTELALHQSMSDYLAFNQTIVQIVKTENKNSFEAYERMVKEFDPMMDSLSYFYPEILQSTIYVRDFVIPHGTYLRPAQEIENEEWAAPTDNNIHWYADAEQGTMTLVRSMPLLDDGEGGFLYISMDYSKIFDSMNLAVNADYGVFVYNEVNEALYENQQITKNAKYRMGFADFQKLQKTEKQNTANYILLEKEITQNGWHAACYLPKKGIISPMQPILLMVLLMWAVCVAFSAAVIMKFSGNMAHRLEKLTKTMTQVDEGNLEVELVSAEKDEIGDLTRGFNQMLSRIRQLIQEVYESRIRQKQYEMTALRAQINPHFLYNSLSLINWKALEIGSDDISKATLALSRYYRTSLNKGKNMMSVREEIDNVRSYLQIQEMFHDYSFEVKMDIAEDILDYRTLNLILQPLAENAIAHGIDRRRGSDPGVITITGRRDGGCVVLSVADNGVGMEQEKAQTILTEKSSGYGVRNVNSRIRLEYGEAYGLSIESEPGKGTKVIVRIPVVEMEVQA